jgi:hypothetical protein
LFDEMTSWKNDLTPFYIGELNLAPLPSFSLVKVFLVFDEMASCQSDKLPFIDIYGFNLAPVPPSIH